MKIILTQNFFFIQEILRLYEMSENNERKRISSAIHKRNKNKMMRYRQLCSNDEEFLSFKDGFLEQVKIKLFYQLKSDID